MSRKPNPPPDDKEQMARFIADVKSLGVLDTQEELSRAMRILTPKTKNNPTNTKKHNKTK